MEGSKEQLQRLLIKLESVSRKQDEFQREMSLLKIQIDRLRKSLDQDEVQSSETTANKSEEEKIERPSADSESKSSSSKQTSDPSSEKKVEVGDTFEQFYAFGKASEEKASFKKPTDFERFIGENLINKIGILIIIIGVVFGVRYAINHELISELWRIVLAYVLGGGLLGFAFALKKKYESYSAVLLSGAMAIMYFTTFVAYNFYDLLPQIVAFGLMVLITVFNVGASLKYNRSVIAHIGLVGAYAIPFLLSDNDGNPEILFSYITIINAGILFISFKKNWKSLYYSAFSFSWLIYLFWFLLDYSSERYFATGLIFSTLFFLIFYQTFIAYKFRNESKLDVGDILILLFNSFIYYGIGYALLESYYPTSKLLGLFTLMNAMFHFGAGVLVQKRKMTDPGLFYFVSGLVLIFLTMAIPVQLDGNWVTLLWALEAALLYWIGRSKALAIYEKLSYPLIILAFFSLLQDFANGYDVSDQVIDKLVLLPILNVNFLTSLVFIGAFSFIVKIQLRTEELASSIVDKNVQQLLRIGIPSFLIIAMYLAFFVEISTYWKQIEELTSIVSNFSPDLKEYNPDIQNYKVLWLFNYTIAFLSLVAFLNNRRIKKSQLSLAVVVLISIAISLFFIEGKEALDSLRRSFLYRGEEEYFSHGMINIIHRYLSLGFVSLGIYAISKTLKSWESLKVLEVPFDLFRHFTILWVLSTELVQWLDVLGSNSSISISLSILWGLYSLALIFYGIAKHKKYLRLGAMGLFGLTLLKLVLRDLSYLDTMSKTIVFIALGILLLIISFLYNKFKGALSEEESDT